MEVLSDIEKLLKGVGKVQEGFSSCPKRDFNVFSLCGVDHYELWHSKIIAHFLSPQGTHGFKGEFLRAFVQCFGLGEYSDNAIVRTEVVARSGEMDFGRFDILIEDGKNTCIIENKIFAVEQPGQLERYKTWLGQKRNQGGVAYLVFLSLDGRKAESTNDGYVQVAYSPDSNEKSLCRWIDRCAEIAKEKPFVRGTLLQYREHIKNIISGGNVMDNQIVQKLKENMRAAADVYRNYQASAISFAKSILENDVLAKLGADWRCESGLSFSRRESGVRYVPPALSPVNDVKGQIFVVFAETGLVQCQVALWQDENNRIVDDKIFSAAVDKCGLKEGDGWRVCKSNVANDSWPVWCPILMGQKEEFPYGIDWDGEFFDKYSKNEERFKEQLLSEITTKIGQLYDLQLAISRRLEEEISCSLMG